MKHAPIYFQKQLIRGLIPEGPPPSIWSVSSNIPQILDIIVVLIMVVVIIILRTTPYPCRDLRSFTENTETLAIKSKVQRERFFE